MNHQKHSYLMIGLLVVGAALFFSGSVGGSALFLLWPLACMGMMFMMMRGMSGMQNGPDHTPDSLGPHAPGRPDPLTPVTETRTAGLVPDPRLQAVAAGSIRLIPSTQRSRHVRSVYERAAAGYDGHYRRWWLAAAGRSAEQAMLAAVVPVVSALHHAQVLDAGAGTGALSRQLQQSVPGLHPNLVDLSPAMLARAADLGDPRAVVTLDALPFADDTFDVVLCGWVIETVNDPAAVITELLRVLRPNGLLTYSFCSLPTRRRDRWRTVPLRAIVHSLFAGHFLAQEQTPFHDCGRSSRRTFAGSAVTVITLGKCCTVT